MEYQTTVQDPTAILRGSGMLEISAVAASPSWTDVGAIQGLKATEELEVNAEENDNTDSTDRVTKQTLTIACTLMEAISDGVRTLIRGALDTRTPTAAAKVNDASQVVQSGGWDYNTFIPIEHQNSDGSILQIDTTGHVTVVAGTDGSLTVVTDFDMVCSNGIWGIIVKDSTKLTTIAQTLTIGYDYTPAASVKWQTGDKSELTKFMARITTLNDDDTFVVTAYYGNIKKGFSLDYQKDDANDRRVGLPVEFIFKTLPDTLGNAANQGKVWDSVQISGF